MIEIAGYQLGDELGRGGFGVVYRATRERDRAASAVKVSADHDDARTTLVREQRVLASLDASIAPAVLDAGTLPDGRPWLALELITWPALEQLRDRGVTCAEGIAAIGAVARAVAALHACGLVHGDLKPANAFVAPDLREARLIDFGSARPVGSRAAAAIGTPMYMAPEQCEDGDPLASAASDVYALGVLLYELVAGRCPFVGTSLAELRQAHAAHRPPPLPPTRALSAELEAMLRRALAKRPSDRPDIAELAASLAHGDVAPTTPPVAPTAVVAPASIVRRMGLLAFEPRCDAQRLQQLLQAMGGRIGHVAPARTIALFDSEASEAPFGRLVRAAQHLAAAGAIASGVAGVADVTAHQRRGREILLSPAFALPAFDPARVPGGWLGVLPAAEHLVGDLPLEAMPGCELACLALDGGPHRTSTMIATARDSLVGHRALIDAVLASCGDALRMQRSAIQVLIGEAGVGKSHLAGVLADRLGALDAHVLAVRAPETLLGEPFELLARLFHALLELPLVGPADCAALLEARLPSGTWPAVALALGWLAPSAPELASFGAPGALRATLASALAAALISQAREGLVLLLDDLHHVDDVVLDALDRAALPEHAVGFAVVAFGRALPADRAAWGRRASAFSVRDLGPLPARDAEELVRKLLAPVEHVPRDAVMRIVERARGLPRMMMELVRGLRAEGAIRIEPTGRAVLVLDRIDDDAGNATIEWLAERELRGLGDALAGHARLAALLGAAFSIDELAGVVAILDRTGGGEVVPLDPGVGLERLASAGLLVAAERGRWDFRYPLLREAIGRTASPAFRAAAHEAAYRHHAETTHDLVRIAHHAERTPQPARAIDPLLALGRDAMAKHLDLPAQLHLGRALALLEDADPRRGEVLRARGIACYRLGRYTDALGDLRAARALARSPVERAELLLDEAMALDWMVAYAPAATAVADAEVAVHGLDIAPGLALRLLVARGRCELRAGALEPAVARLHEAHALGEQLGEAAYESRVVALLMLAPLLAMLGRADESALLFERATALCDLHHDRMHLVSVIQNQIPLHMARADHAGAVTAVERARALSRELGLVASEYRQLCNLADIHIQAGHAELALAQLEHAAALSRLVHDASPPDLALLGARAALLAGRRDDARRAIANISRDQLGAAELVLVRAIELCTTTYDRDAWIAAVVDCDHLDGQSDVIEVHDLMWRAADAASDRDTAALARAAFEAALGTTPSFYGLRRSR